MSEKMEEILINNYYAKHIESIYDKNDMTKSEPSTVKSLIPTTDFFKKFLRKFDRSTDILPNNCKFTRTLSGGYKIFVIEDEPRIRTISYRGDHASVVERHKLSGKYEAYGLDKVAVQDTMKFTISLPYVIYIITLSRSNTFYSMKVFFRLHPLTSFNDYILEPNLANIDGDYHVCLGFSNEYKQVGNSSSVIRQLIDEFWFNNFNHDYNGHIENYNDVPEVCDLFTWQYNTKVDPLFIFTTKWKPAGRWNNIGDILLPDSFSNAKSNDVATAFKSLVQEINTDGSDGTGKFTTRDLDNCESILLDGTLITISDEIIIDKEKWYVNGFMHNDCGDTIGVQIESAEDAAKVQVINVSKRDSSGCRNLLKSVQIEKIKEININKDLTLTEGDLVFFDFSKDVRILERIIKTRDGMYNLKIGRDFYLPSSFLKKNLKKVDKDFKFFDIELVPNNSYCWLDTENHDSILKRYEEGVFLKFSAKNSKLCFEFKKKNGGTLEIYYNERNYFTPVNNSLVASPPIYVLYDEIFINNPKDTHRTYIIKGKGIGASGYSDYIPISERKLICKYNREFVKDLFSLFCASNSAKLTLPSFENDIEYSVGDQVIAIDWQRPDSMFEIMTITGFTTNATHFCLSLSNGETTTQYPIVTLSNGKNNFASVRKVTTKINNYAVGMRLRSLKSGIPDFPGKDCNEIKAFIIDEEREPLVLFSNYRTLWFSSLTKDNFKVINTNTKVGAKIKVSPPNLKIKMQDGDIFIGSEGIKLSVVYSKYYKRFYFYNLSCSSYDGLRTMPFGKIENSNRRYGLLLPRSTDSQLNIGEYIIGYPTLYGGVINSENSNRIGLRKNYVDLIADKLDEDEISEILEPQKINLDTLTTTATTTTR